MIRTGVELDFARGRGVFMIGYEACCLIRRLIREERQHALRKVGARYN
jgi:hypothetical protein